MNSRDLPVVGDVFDAGADDRVFDGLLLVGPLVVLVVALLGRRAPTVGLASAYLAVFCGYVLYRGVRGPE